PGEGRGRQARLLCTSLPRSKTAQARSSRPRILASSRGSPETTPPDVERGEQHTPCPREPTREPSSLALGWSTRANNFWCGLLPKTEFRSGVTPASEHV